jgi:5-methylcytosine-specific restriction endonuclease McrA
MSQPLFAERVLTCPVCGNDNQSCITGYEIRGIYDGVLIWICSKCDHQWPRFHPPGRLYDYAVLMIAKMEKENE